MHGNLHQICPLRLYFLVQEYFHFPFVLFGVILETEKDLNNTKPT